ncbi:hypothetical protein LZQ00_00690 [Sphingobacterium sp. SRCM116780]|uniref:hypothetical protein n=1 Tax=Sphingobacterium sp. SRCM116780 TaxID=2907623 RepID=UPI001F16F6E0|nr:hypothetical protein [Sphingobacterium sp. SRCM116780]UIR56359.1 hypothetical protein LZQ00_00690 [Sphingobacterium sp. SRCM116780]
MSQTICTQSAKFAIGGEAVFPGTKFQVDITFTDPSLTASNVLASEWFLDGVLVDGINGLQLKGQGYCGDHIVAARILTNEGWSGLKTFAFANCKSMLNPYLVGPTSLKEGSSAEFKVIRPFTDDTTFDVSSSYTFSATEGYFERNIFHSEYSDSLVGTKTIDIQAQFDGTTLIQQIDIINIDQPVVPIADFDYMIIRYNWQDGASGGLDVAVGLENTDSGFNNQYVGYGNPSAIIPDNGTESNAYLWWANDNVKSTGEESVLINVKKFTEDFAANTIMGDFTYTDFSPTDFSVDDIKNVGEVGLYAIWRGAPSQYGLFQVEIKAYKGGTMQLQGTEFINQGGTELYKKTYTLSTKKENSNLLTDYYRFGKLRFNKKTRKSTISL